MTTTPWKSCSAQSLAATLRLELQSSGPVPIGNLFHRVMEFADLCTYEKVVRALIDLGEVRRDEYHMLHWVG